MSGRVRELERRRRELQLQCALERDLVAADVADIHDHLSGIDRLVAGARAFVKRPGVIIAVVVGLAIIGPSRILRFASRALVLATAARRVVHLVRK